MERNSQGWAGVGFRECRGGCVPNAPSAGTAGEIPSPFPRIWDRWQPGLTPISLGQKPQCQTTPRSRGCRTHQDMDSLLLLPSQKTPPKQIHHRTKAQRIKLGVFSPKLNWALPRQPRVVPSLGKDTGKVLGDTAATSVSPPGDPSPHPAPQLQARHSFALRIPWIFLLLTGLKW